VDDLFYTNAEFTRKHARLFYKSCACRGCAGQSVFNACRFPGWGANASVWSLAGLRSQLALWNGVL